MVMAACEIAANCGARGAVIGYPFRGIRNKVLRPNADLDQERHRNQIYFTPVFKRERHSRLPLVFNLEAI